MSENPKLTLITNVQFVSFENGLRCQAHAILVEPPMDPPLGQPRAQIRGFGVDGALPTFTMWLPDENTDFTLIDAHDDSKIIVSDSGAAKPIFSGGILTVASNGQQIFLQSEDSEQPFSVELFDRNQITKVWEELPKRVARFWSAPNMPTVRWQSADWVRSFYGPSESTPIPRLAPGLLP